MHLVLRTLMRHSNDRHISIPSKERETGRLDEIKLYTAENVKRTIGFDCSQLILFALVTGGDYSSGIPGGGKLAACEIVRSPIGETFRRLLSGWDGNEADLPV